MARLASELHLNRKDLDLILRQAKKGRPIESCGLMIGTRKEGAYVCDHVIPAENVDRSPVSFTIAPEELLKGYRHADEAGMEIVGIYHSHPARAAPSRTDVGFMKWSAPVWLIVSNLDWQYAAFALDGEKPVGVKLILD